ncbi:MAG: hypothetical protein HOJ35_07315 [Bdellovibrionales bacterium]|jgi:biopolymer transport protein TolQ|nr:hypothetical protein [Bdellovibrionales bacterium]
METVNLNILTILMDAGPVVKLVLFLLFLTSIISWAIIFQKRAVIVKAKKNNRFFMDLYSISPDLDDLLSKVEKLSFSPFQMILKSTLIDLDYLEDGSKSEKEINQYKTLHVERSIKKGINESNQVLDKSLATLASIGSISPFIGLFGTVWGIINSFTGLATGGGTLEVVAPGIAEALVATALGLATAIPAVWFFNYFSSEISRVNTDMETFGQDLLNNIERSTMLD